MPDYDTATGRGRDPQRQPSQIADQPSQIVDALRCMAGALKEQENAITELEQRLQSVLRASGPEREKSSEKAPPPRVALAQEITHQVLGFSGQTERIESILSRLEL